MWNVSYDIIICVLMLALEEHTRSHIHANTLALLPCSLGSTLVLGQEYHRFFEKCRISKMSGFRENKYDFLLKSEIRFSSRFSTFVENVECRNFVTNNNVRTFCSHKNMENRTRSISICKENLWFWELMKCHYQACLKKTNGSLLDHCIYITYTAEYTIHLSTTFALYYLALALY